jgi:ABC-type nickel/cobalt efflux system permease component RcnA
MRGRWRPARAGAGATTRRRPARPRRLLLAPLAVVIAFLLGAAPAAAHPLGNFSVNHLAKVRVSADRVEVRYVLDLAEIPTFQARGTPAAARLAQARQEVLRGLRLTVDGRAVPLRLTGPGSLTMPPGAGGLKTTRVDLTLTAAVRRPRRVQLSDATYPGRVGWKGIVVGPGRDTAVRSNAPLGDPTNGLRSYPEDLLDSPADMRSATFQVAPGAGTVSGPDGTRSVRAEGGERAGQDGFAAVFEDAAAGEGVLLFLLLTAFGWGALHALSPGHGKAMVAAYLVGTRGTAGDAVALGATVTFTHTIGVIALGLVALLLSAYILPEHLYPWLQLVSGLLVVSVGAAVLRERVRARSAPAGHHHGHGLFGHGHAHPHAHSHDNAHDHGHDRADVHVHDDSHAHAHAHGGHDARSGLLEEPPEGDDHRHGGRPAGRARRRTLLALGASAGLVPCPSALVVLLGAVSQHQVGLGLVLILAFSAGLAMTLTVLGLGVVYASSALSRLRVPRSAITAVPIVSAVVIVGVGCLLTAQAFPLID